MSCIKILTNKIHRYIVCTTGSQSVNRKQHKDAKTMTKRTKLIYRDREWPATYTFEVRWDGDCERMHDKAYRTFTSARNCASRNNAPKCEWQGDLGRSYIVVLDETHTPIAEVWD